MSAPGPTLPPTPPMPIDELPAMPNPVPPVPEEVSVASTSTAPAAALAAIGGDQKRPSPYRQVFPDLVQAYRRRGYQDVVRLAEETEISYPTMKERPTRVLITIPLVLSYLFLNDLPSAYWALERLPKVLHTFGPIRALGELLSAIASRNYAQIPLDARNLISVTTGSLQGEDELDLAIRPLVEEFIRTYQTHLIIVLGQAYASLSMADAAVYLGKAHPDANPAFTAVGWKFDEATSCLTPTPTMTQSNGVISVLAPSAAPSTLMDFVGIASGASRLESAI
ncbi:hypothetical protein DACRYDRAFT_117178 [Dacryopinax primogenitus]|uniref:CSN8/PSMD8/EIF3K domain-containing protein n=1 Tax=Dacryopinax primogenitus (strain DJM 731) TaxID=1858805 RepID=M5FWK9_DACPD|nr:uncharacterized protein DACRYDRAFT_117178 [Dacryopinax primogenitus]EJU00769.1 hypothetical protein DACRYDRAFT_117178 [Dacryopinax primogenitus]